jgi:hypothetical protein
MNILEEIKEKGSIQLIRTDFVSLDIESHQFKSQFTTPRDCPIARALKRLGFKNVNIGVESDFTYDGKNDYLKTQGSFADVQRVATEISNGAEFGEIFISK